MTLKHTCKFQTLRFQFKSTTGANSQEQCSVPYHCNQCFQNR